MEKSLLKSKTFWFNILMALSVLVPSVNEWLKTNPLIFASVWSGIAVVLRYITKDKVILIP